MLKNKAIFAIGATFLFLAVAMIPASASVTENLLSIQERESVTDALNRLTDKIEKAENFVEIREIIKEFCSDELFSTTPVLRDILVKVIEWIFSKRSLFSSGSVISSIFNKGLFDDRSKEKFVISFGSYQKGIFSKKDEKLTLFKQGFAFWRYSGKAKLSQGRTIIAERKPFGIQQQIRGSQIGIMLGFTGLFIDVESKLTGNSYVFVMGNARRAKAFDLTSFSD